MTLFVGRAVVGGMLAGPRRRPSRQASVAWGIRKFDVMSGSPVCDRVVLHPCSYPPAPTEWVVFPAERRSLPEGAAGLDAGTRSGFGEQAYLRPRFMGDPCPRRRCRRQSFRPPWLEFGRCRWRRKGKKQKKREKRHSETIRTIVDLHGTVLPIVTR